MRDGLIFCIGRESKGAGQVDENHPPGLPEEHQMTIDPEDVSDMTKPLDSPADEAIAQYLATPTASRGTTKLLSFLCGLISLPDAQPHL